MIERQGIEDHSMVSRDAGGVNRANPVGQNADSVTIKATEHGSRGAGCKRGGRNAGEAGKRLAQLSAQADIKRVALDGAGAVEQIEIDRRVTNHHDPLVIGMGIVVGSGPVFLASECGVGSKGDGQCGKAKGMFQHGARFTRYVILYQAGNVCFVDCWQQLVTDVGGEAVDWAGARQPAS